MLTSILSGASIILGIFIIISYFNGSPNNKSDSSSTQAYHLGCYLTHQEIQKHAELLNKISELEQKSYKLHSKISSNPITKDNLDQRSIELARNFESYLQELEAEKDKRRGEVELAKAVKNAYNQFNACSEYLKEATTLDTADCVSSWETYSKCSGQLQILQQRLSAKLNEKSGLSLKMKELLDDISNPSVPKPSIHDELHRQFKLKADKLEDEQKKIDNDLRILLKKIPNVEYAYGTILNSTKHAKQFYLDCHQNRAEFRLCEELSEEVKGLGHGSIESLGLKVQKKNKALNRIQKMLNQNTSGNEAKRELAELYRKQFSQYIKLHRLYIETKARLEKHCGCTEKQEQRLRVNYQSKIKQLQAKQSQLDDLNLRKKDRQREISEIKLAREELERQYKRKLKERQEKDNEKQEQAITALELLAQLEKQDRTLQLEILSQREQFKNLQLRCKKIKDIISSQIQEIDEISACLKKKNYFQKLHNKYEGMKAVYPVSERAKSSYYKNRLNQTLGSMQLLNKAIVNELDDL